jgi:signal peptidase I
VVIPAELSALSLRFLVPSPGASDGIFRVVAEIGNQYPVLLGFALFFLFSALARYWQFAIPPGGYLTALPGGIATRAPVGAPRRRENVLFVLGVGSAAASAFAVRAVLVESYEVLSASMLPTLEPGDRVLANKAAYTVRLFSPAPTYLARLPHRTELVVFKNTTGDGPPQLIKRIIGLPGDRMTMRGDHPVINGWEVPSCDAGTYVYPLLDGFLIGRLRVEFLDEEAYLTVQQGINQVLREAYEVRPDEVFVLGDNRSNSSDSRAWNGGRGKGVSFADISGRAQWLLVATHRDGRANFGDMLQRLERRLYVQGVDTRSLQQGIDNCLKKWPNDTRPPQGDVPMRARQSSRADDHPEQKL